MKRADTANEFGRLIRELRGSRRQKDIAHELHRSRTLVASIETGHSRPTPEFLSDFVELFPEHEQALIRTYNELPPKTRRGRTQRVTREDLAQRRIDSMIERGRAAEAKAGIELSLHTESDPTYRVWLLEQLGQLELQDGNRDATLDLYAKAIDAADAASLAERASEIRNHLAGLFTHGDQFPEAHAVVDARLLIDPADGRLWRRKGIIHWYAHSYPDAYACLTTAHAFGQPVSRIVHSRGQVLAEWGNYPAALADLDHALDQPASDRDHAYARSTRAYVYAQLGDLDLALKEFAVAEEVTPDNAWLHYFRALCYIRYEERDRAIAGLEAALACDIPPLNGPKRERALQLLHDYGITQDSNKP